MQDIGSLARRTRLTALLVTALMLGACAGGSAGSSTNSSSTTNYSATGTTPGTATLSWNAPTENADGTQLTDLAGYRVYYGTNPNDLSQSIEVSGAQTTTYAMENLAAGTYYFAVAAYNTSGVESEQSNVESKTI